MIVFTCPVCQERLEGDDDLRGRRMACPGCTTLIDVPMDAPAPAAPETKKSRAEDRLRRLSRKGPSGVGLTLAIVAGILVAGFTILLVAQAADRARKASPPRTACAPCQATGKETCRRCGGSKTEACPNAACKMGQAPNYKGEIEACKSCTGRGTIECAECGGAGYYSCQVCLGAGTAPE